MLSTETSPYSDQEKNQSVQIRSKIPVASTLRLWHFHCAVLGEIQLNCYFLLHLVVSGLLSHN